MSKKLSRITITYLAKLGVLISYQAQTGLISIEKIDEPNQIALDMELCFIPKTLKSDTEAMGIVYNISDITLDDETITTELREIIVEDCWTILSNL